MSRPDEPACLVIDPGAEPSLILSVIEEQKLEPIAVLVTHGHIDHVGALAAGAANTSPIVGARNTFETVPRNNRSSIGRHSSATFQLLVLPNDEYFE